MCAIAGIIGPAATAFRLQSMLNIQAHRGPDHSDILLCEGSFAIGHNRLSIIDISEAAHQPFVSENGRYILTFNGEIYNYKELKAELKSAFCFRTHSDTEVLLNSFIHWGVNCLQHLNGMFSFAVWDNEEESLFVARDRFGVKPFYYSQQNASFYFASEIPAFFAAGLPAHSHEKVWASYFVHGTYGTGSDSFWKDIFVLEAGHYLYYKQGQLSLKRWYCFEDNITISQRLDVEEEEHIHTLLQEAITLRFRADVPVGISLSGGLDSATLLALIRQNANHSGVKAFTFVTGDERYDELPWVKKMLEIAVFPLRICKLSADEVPELALKLAQWQMEPCGGLPTLAYSKIFEAAREEGIYVLLDGQGADESWAGYDYYTKADGGIIQGIIHSPFKAEVLDPDFAALAEVPQYNMPFDSQLLNMQYRDLFYTKIPRVLRFNDRISMMHGTELREPFLDYRLVEYIFSRPEHFKLKDGVQKWFFRQIASQWLSPEITYSPKRVMQTPQREWLAGPLEDWATDMIDTLGGNSWFNKKALKAETAKYMQGEQDSSFHLWQWINTALIWHMSKTNKEI